MAFVKLVCKKWDGIIPLSKYMQHVIDATAQSRDQYGAHLLMRHQIVDQAQYDAEKENLMRDTDVAFSVLRTCFEDKPQVLILVDQAQDKLKPLGRTFPAQHSDDNQKLANTIYDLVQTISTGAGQSHFSMMAKAYEGVAKLRFHGEYRTFKAQVLKQYDIFVTRREALSLPKDDHVCYFKDMLFSFPPAIREVFIKELREEKPKAIVTLPALLDKADIAGEAYDATEAIASVPDTSSTSSYSASATHAGPPKQAGKKKKQANKKWCDYHQRYGGHSTEECRNKKQHSKSGKNFITSSQVIVRGASVNPPKGYSIGIDSHASHTVVPYPGLLHEYQEYESPMPVSAYDGSTKLKCHGEGVLVLDLRFNGMKKPLRICIREAVYIPGATGILIQSKKLCNSKQFPVGFAEDPYTRVYYGDFVTGPEIRCLSTRVAFMPNKRVGLVYPDNSVKPATEPINISSTSTSTSLAKLNTPRKMSMEVLHKRLGHRSEVSVKAEARLRNLKLTTDTIGFCEVCVEAKSTKKPINTSRSKLRDRALQSVQKSKSPSFFEYDSHKDPVVTEVHMVSATDVDKDSPKVESVLLERQRVIVSDLFSVQIKDRPYYVALFKDVETRYVFAYGMKNKHRLPHALRAFLASNTVRIHAGDILYSDNESVYRGQEFLDALRENSLRPMVGRSCPPHTPQLNGYVERTIRDIKTTAAALVVGSGLNSDDVLTYAIMHATRIYNYSMHSAIGMSPYQALYRRIAPIEELRVFGSPAYVHMMKHQQAEFGKKTRHGFYVGNLDRNGTFQVWMADTHKVIETIHVDFNENFDPDRQSRHARQGHDGSDDGDDDATALVAMPVVEADGPDAPPPPPQLIRHQHINLPRLLMMMQAAQVTTATTRQLHSWLNVKHPEVRQVMVTAIVATLLAIVNHQLDSILEVTTASTCTVSTFHSSVSPV